MGKYHLSSWTPITASCNLPEERKATAPLNFQHQQKSFKSLCHSILSSEPSPGLADCSLPPPPRLHFLGKALFGRRKESEGGEALEHFRCVFLLCLRSQQEPTPPHPDRAQLEILGPSGMVREEVENHRMQLHSYCTERKRKLGPREGQQVCPRSQSSSEVDLDQSPSPRPQPSFSHIISSWAFQVGRPSSTRY